MRYTVLILILITIVEMPLRHCSIFYGNQTVQFVNNPLGILTIMTASFSPYIIYNENIENQTYKVCGPLMGIVEELAIKEKLRYYYFLYIFFISNDSLRTSLP